MAPKSLPDPKRAERFLLFVLTFVINLAAASTIFKKRRKGGLR